MYPRSRETSNPRSSSLSNQIMIFGALSNLNRNMIFTIYTPEQYLVKNYESILFS